MSNAPLGTSETAVRDNLGRDRAAARTTVATSKCDIHHECSNNDQLSSATTMSVATATTASTLVTTTSVAATPDELSGVCSLDDRLIPPTAVMRAATMVTTATTPYEEAQRQ